MADKAEFLQAINEAILDADSLERFINGSDSETVLTRLSAQYPTLQKVLKELFENGGLPATPFATKALMTASAIADGSYAMVTDDSVLADNGLYQKVSGVWSKSKYDPLLQAQTYTDTNIKKERTVTNDYTLRPLYITDEQLRNTNYDRYSVKTRILKKPFDSDGTIESIDFMLGGFASGKSVVIDINILDVVADGFVSVDTYRITDALSATGTASEKQYIFEPKWLDVNSVAVNIPFKKGQVISFRSVNEGTVRGYFDDATAHLYPDVLLQSTGTVYIRAGQFVRSSDYVEGNSIIGINFKASSRVDNDAHKVLNNQVLGLALDVPFKDFSSSALLGRYRVYNDGAKQSGVISSISFKSGNGGAADPKNRTDADYLIGFRLGIFKPNDRGELILDRYYDIRNDSKDSFKPMRVIPKNTYQTIELNIPIEKGEHIGHKPFIGSIMSLSTTYFENGNGYTYFSNNFTYTGNKIELNTPTVNQQSLGVSIVLDYQDVRASKSAEIAQRVSNRDDYLLQAPFDVETRSKKWSLGHACQDSTLIGDYILSGADNNCYLHNLSDKKRVRTIAQDIGHMGNLDYSPLHDYLSSVPLQNESYYIADGRQQVKFIKNFSSHIDSASYNVADMDIVSVYFDKGVGLDGVFTSDDTSQFRHLYPHFVFDNAQKGLGYLFLTGSYGQRLVVAKVSLGMGSNDLSILDNGFGTFTSGVADGEFNGTSMLLGKWYSMSTGSYQGGCVFGGKLYISWSRPAAFDGNKAEPTAYRKNELIRFAFGEDGTMRIDKMYTSHELDADGREASIEVESAFCDGTYIYNNSVGGALYAYPLDYSTPMRGSAVIGVDGTVTVDYDFACNSTPHVQITPTNEQAVGAYVSSKTATGFTVTGADGATFDWEAPITR